MCVCLRNTLTLQRNEAVTENSCKSTPQSGMTNCWGLRLVVWGSQMEMRVSLRNIMWAPLAYPWPVRFEISVGNLQKVSMQAGVFCQRGTNVHKGKSFNGGIVLALAKVRRFKVRPAKVGVRPGKPKDWVWIRPTIQSHWKTFLSLLFFASKLRGNLAIVQSFEEAGSV